jgi:hypothetical protein
MFYFKVLNCMSRLFITQREQNLISDLTMELIKDVAGQKIYLYPFSELKTQTNIYSEAAQKIFDNPIVINALVSNPVNTTVSSLFGPEETFKLECYVHYKDMVNKELDFFVGDVFSYGNNFYEILSANWIKTIYGEIEYKDGVKLSALKIRESQFKQKFIGPTDLVYTDPDALQIEFTQQRGLDNAELQNGDVRELQKNGVLDPPAKVSKVSTKADTANSGAAFSYDDE